MVKCSSDARLTRPQEPGASAQDLLTAKQFPPRVRLCVFTNVVLERNHLYSTDMGFTKRTVVWEVRLRS